jgi:hypothetical protein
VDGHRWCAVTEEAKAKAIAVSDRFASGSSAMLHSRGGKLGTLIVMTESEDAYVEDRYTFDAGLSVAKLDRRGHYINDPYISVTFLRIGNGPLALSPTSKQLVQSETKAGHETYFVDWPHYRSFAEFPFASVVRFRRSLTVTHHCPARP